jgi:hypothetical protein
MIECRQLSTLHSTFQASPGMDAGWYLAGLVGPCFPDSTRGVKCEQGKAAGSEDTQAYSMYVEHPGVGFVDFGVTKSTKRSPSSKRPKQYFQITPPQPIRQ